MHLLDLARENFASAPLGFLIAAHLVGDFLLQDDEMAKAKASSTKVCCDHIMVYQFLFMLLVCAHMLPIWAYLAILAQHFAQDRWALHLRWMRFFGQTPPDRWPVGPLVVDQAFHVSFIALVALFL